MEIIEVDDDEYMSELYTIAHDMFGDCEYSIDKYIDKWLRQEWNEEKQTWIVQPKICKESKEMWLKYKIERGL